MSTPTHETNTKNVQMYTIILCTCPHNIILYYTFDCTSVRMYNNKHTFNITLSKVDNRDGCVRIQYHRRSSLRCGHLNLQRTIIVSYLRLFDNHINNIKYIYIYDQSSIVITRARIL